MPRSQQTPRRDAYEVVSERIIAALEQGTVPWRQPWLTRGHRNALTSRPYRGINLLVLAISAIQREWRDPRWLTFRQAASRGGHVRRGERGTAVVLWRWLERDDPLTGEPAERYPLLRVYTVFNVAQCDGLELPGRRHVAFDPLERAEAIVSGYAGGPGLEHDADCAYYSPSADVVYLPPRADFRDADGYYATLFHELAHSTGHPSRLNRPNFQAGVTPFGSENYSREELLAEFTAAFLCADAGIDASRLDQSAAYVASWLRALQDDRRIAVIAASQAQRAADHILGRVADDRAEGTPEEDAMTDTEHAA